MSIDACIYVRTDLSVVGDDGYLLLRVVEEISQNVAEDSQLPGMLRHVFSGRETGREERQHVVHHRVLLRCTKKE